VYSQQACPVQRKLISLGCSSSAAGAVAKTTLKTGLQQEGLSQALALLSVRQVLGIISRPVRWLESQLGLSGSRKSLI
jgi:hypothetical protein